MTQIPRISFIIVNYNSAQFLSTCLSSIRQNVQVPYEIIIVNNDSQHLQEENFGVDVSIIERGTNAGFSSACNDGAQRAQAKVLCFLNPDAKIITKNVEEIVLHIEKNKGIVGAQLIDEENNTQPWSVGCEMTVSEIIRSNLGFPCSKRLWKSDHTQDVAWVSGAGLWIDAETFGAVEGFDERFFLYYEDVDICRRVRAHGKKVCYMPHVHIQHIGGGSVVFKERQKKQYYCSQDYYFAKHFGKQKQKILAALRALARPMKS